MPQDYDEIAYRKNFLAEVIVRVDFPQDIKHIASSLPPKIAAVAKQNFPILEPRQAVEKNIQVSGKSFASHEKEFMEWHFHGVDRGKTLAFTPRAFYITYKQYQKYEGLKTEFKEILDSFFDIFSDSIPSRLGLRYINSIDVQNGNPLDWAGLLNDKLIYLFQFPDKPTDLSRVFHNIEFALDDFNIRYQFGMHNPDYPARIRKKVFILDFDAYYQGPIDCNDIMGMLDKFHQEIQILFEKSITEDLRGKMNE